MIRSFYFLILLLIPFIHSSAQNNSSMQGEYYLRGVMETASGFKLNADSTFEFFFSYGALDRYGSGKWQQVGSTIVLNSRPQPERDFALIKSEKVAGKFITFRIIDNNEMLLRYVDVIFKGGKSIIEKTASEKGIIQIPIQPVDSIAVLFKLCPDRFSTFAVSNKEHNSFEFRFEPWIAEVFFKDFNLKIEKGNFTGKHPLLKGESFTYEKSGPH